SALGYEFGMYCVLSLVGLALFFFQAEDGIRDRNVTGVQTCALPISLYNALKAMRDDKLVKEALGDHIYKAFYEHKMVEWDQYRANVSDWELEQYLDQY